MFVNGDAIGRMLDADHITAIRSVGCDDHNSVVHGVDDRSFRSDKINAKVTKGGVEF